MSDEIPDVLELCPVCMLPCMPIGDAPCMGCGSVLGPADVGDLVMCKICTGAGYTEIGVVCVACCGAGYDV